MADETLRKPGEGGKQDATTDTKEKVATEKVGAEITEQKLKENLEPISQKQTESEARIAKIEFENEFKVIADQYPHATELRDKISEKVKSGVPLADAAVIVLNAEGKLQKREDVEREAAGMEGMGGSAPTLIRSGNTKVDEAVRALNTPGTITEETLAQHRQTLRDALMEEERKGTIKWQPD